MWKNYIKRIRETACWAYTDAQWYWGNKDCLFSLYKYILIEQYALKHFYFSDSFHAFHISSLNLWKSDNLKKINKTPPHFSPFHSFQLLSLLSVQYHLTSASSRGRQMAEHTNIPGRVSDSRWRYCGLRKNTTPPCSCGQWTGQGYTLCS